MELLLNGKPYIVEGGTTVGELLAQLGIKGGVAVELNGMALFPEDRDQRLLAEGDIVELVRFVGGG